MAFTPKRVFLDTNVFILGALDATSAEAQILDWAGMGENAAVDVEIVVSPELFDEIRRVSRRLYNKDWAGQLMAYIWQRLRLHYVVIDDNEVGKVVETGLIPREDAEVYVTARVGQANCFVSANHKLIRSLVQHTGDFECLTPDEFAKKYVK